MDELLFEFEHDNYLFHSIIRFWLELGVFFISGYQTQHVEKKKSTTRFIHTVTG